MSEQQTIARREETWVEAADLGAERPYLPTFADGRSAAVQRYLKAPRHGVRIITDIPGALRREDAAKLYEMAFFSEGNILELGTSRGLSISIMAEAVVDTHRAAVLVSVDINEAASGRAKAFLSQRGYDDLVELIVHDAAAIGARLAARGVRFGFVFVDHSHAYDDVLIICRLLRDLVTPGGFVLFHDYNDSRNIDETMAHYGVYQAVNDGLPPEFSFHGVFGCSALYRHEAEIPS